MGGGAGIRPRRLYQRIARQGGGVLFVVPAQQHAGVGRALMALAQQAYPALTLEVYWLNRPACRFYHRRGFIPIAQRLNAETGHLILTLHWRAGGIMHSSTPPPS
nr:GNAT family N-acetyltransferase [Candidatus Sodalis pierantonius]